jgi:hypothetical protein
VGGRIGAHALSHWLFLRALGATALAAFVSLHVQVHALFGSEGILPLAPRLERVARSLGQSAWMERPTLLLTTGASDRALDGLCISGEIAAALLMLGVTPGPAALACFAIYASLVQLGSPFLPLQWDTLLLETLALAAIAAPWRDVISRPSRAGEPAHVARWAIWFLLARLMLASGVVKLLGGDPVWRDLSALAYHYETQPLPGPLSPSMHALPGAVHAAGAIFTYVAEIALPPLMFAPRRFRHLAALGTIALQILIALTGNYGFFNALTIALAISLFDDAALLRLVPRRAAPTAASARWWHVALPSALASVMAVLGFFQLTTSLGAPASEGVITLLEASDRARLTSSYGLFANMTTERPELLIEGTVDGATWLPYELHYKPGDPGRGLPFVPMHMPRVDWMLWFAALGEPEDAPWVMQLARALLERRAPVLALLERDPFDGAPPRAIRITRWDYRLAAPGSAVTWHRSSPLPWGPILRAPR